MSESSSSIRTVEIFKVDFAAASRDGQKALFKSRDDKNAELILYFPMDQILSLISMAAAVWNQKFETEQINSISKGYFPISQFELGFDSDNNMPILALTFGQNGKLSFGLPGLIPQQMMETLQVILGQSNLQHLMPRID